MQDANKVEVAFKLSADMQQIVRSGTVDLSQSYVRKAIAAQLVADIDTWALAAFNDGFRTHLGASLIGNECSRQTFYSWRWMAHPAHSGRMQRLFQRGHLEEQRYEAYLRGIGCDVWLADPNTGKQFRVSRVEGHFGGSLDAIGRLPARYGIAADLLLLGEFKTKGTGKGFADLKDKGIMLTNPQHYDQMCTYGANYGYPYAFYMSTNKNDDDMHVEIVPLDFKRAAAVEEKAKHIIALRSAPPRISDNPTFYKCKGCDFHGVCHEQRMPAKNCRSCVHASPAANSSWFCSGWNGIIPVETIPNGCAQWTPLR